MELGAGGGKHGRGKIASGGVYGRALGEGWYWAKGGIGGRVALGETWHWGKRGILGELTIFLDAHRVASCGIGAGVGVGGGVEAGVGTGIGAGVGVGLALGLG